MDRLYQGESRNQNGHNTMQEFPSTSASSSSQENIFVKTQSEDINLNLRSTYSSSLDITTWQGNQQTYIKKPVCFKTSELFEHTYARPSHEENDSERRLESLKIERNLESVCPFRQNDLNIKLNKSLLKESSRQAAADSSLILFESNDSLSCTYTVSSDLDELFEHTYARSSHEENNSEIRLERLKIESNLENVLNIELNKSLLKESSHQAAAGSSLILSENNGSLPRTYKTSPDLDELFEHTYARPSHEENNSEISLERLKIESNIESVCPPRKNDFNIKLSKSLLKESSCQAAADSSFILSESNGSFPCTETSSDVDELLEHTYARPSHEENDSEICLESLKIESNFESICPLRQNEFNIKLNKSMLKESSCQAATGPSLILSESNDSFPFTKTSSDLDKLFEHTYARSSHEENDSETRLESLKTESNLENICSLQQNDFSINLSKSLLKESSCQAADDSVLRLSEGNGSFPSTSQISSELDADLFLNFVNSTFEEYSNACITQNNVTNPMQSEGSSRLYLNEDDEEELKVLLGQQEPASNNFSEPFEILQTLNESMETSDTEIALVENSQPSLGIPETRASNNYDVSRTTEEQSNQVARIRNLINSIVELFALSPLGQIFETARVSTAAVEDVGLLTIFYTTLLEIMVAAQTHNTIQPSGSQVLEEAEDKQNRNKNYYKIKKMRIAKIMSDKKMKSLKNVILKPYLNNGSLSPDTAPCNELQMNTVTCTIRRNVQPCTNESKSKMTLRPRNTVCYQEDSDSNMSDTKESISTITKKVVPTGRVDRKKLVLKKQGINRKKIIHTILSGEENCFGKSFSETSSIDIRNATTSSAVVEKDSDINHNIISSTDSIDRTMGEARNHRPNILSALMNFKHDYFLYRRLVMRDFNIQAQSEKKSRKKKVKNFNIKKVKRQSIKLKFSRFFNGFYNLPSNITKSDASGKWTYRVCQIDKNTTI